MKPPQMADHLVDRLQALCRPDKPSRQVFDELREVHAAVFDEGERDLNPSAASEAFDWCMKGAECYLRLAATFLAAEDALLEREGTGDETGRRR